MDDHCSSSVTSSSTIPDHEKKRTISSLSVSDRELGFVIPSYKRVALHAYKTLKRALLFRQSSMTSWKKTDSSWSCRSSSSEMYRWDEIPEEGLRCDEVLEMFERDVVSSCVPVQNPYFMGHMTTTLPAAVHEADILISYMNQNMVKVETSGGANQLEQVVLSQMHELIYGRSKDYYKELLAISSRQVALMVSGGTMGNLTALTIARNIKLPDIDSLGLSEALRGCGYQKAVVLSSERCHYSLAKICGILGLGKDQLIRIPVDLNTQKMRVDILQRTIEHLERDHVLILACVAVASSTETGSIDDLSEIARICESYGIWFHVDAAWGGAYLLSKKLSRMLIGIEQADSVVIDGHKLLGLTMGGGIVFFKDPQACQHIHHSSHYVARDDSCDSGRFHLEGSRPFYALKLWMLAQRKGRAGLAQLVEGTHQRAQIFKQRLASAQSFIQTTPLETNILTYCWCSPKLQALLQYDPHHVGAVWLFSVLDQIQNQLHALGWQRKLVGFVSKTRLELMFLGKVQTITVLRAVPAQATTTAWHIKDLLDDQRACAHEILSSHLHGESHKVLGFRDSLDPHSTLRGLWDDFLHQHMGLDIHTLTGDRLGECSKRK